MIYIRRIIWDTWNIAHIARHRVIPEEVEQVCDNDPELDTGKKGRIRLIGLTQSKRMLAIILDPEPEEGVYYPVTARPASRRERRYYKQRKEGGGDSDDKAA